MKMNSLKISYILLFLTLGLTACTEKPWMEEEYKKALDSIEGVYEWTGCEWKGPAVDLDQDGIASTDFMIEFEELAPLAAIRVESQNSFEMDGSSGSSSRILCRLPFQFVRTDYESNPDLLYFSTWYKIEKGKVVLEEKLNPSPEIYLFEDLERMGENRILVHTKYAQLEIQLSISVYDYATGSWVEAPAVYQFKRKHY